MKNRKLHTLKFIAGFMCACLLGIHTNASEADRMPDLNGTLGSLTVTMKYTDPNTEEQETMGGVELNLVKVADLEVRGGSAEYTLLDTYSESGVELAGMTTSESMDAAGTLLSYVSDASGVQTVVTNSAGRAVFDDLSAGMYLVYQNEGANEAYRVDDISVMLISVPYPNVSEDGNTWTYQVEIEPKVSLTGPENNGVIEVTKTLFNTETEENENPSEGEITFYVGLFESASDRESIAQKAIIFSRGASETVTFEGLETDKTYYIAEVDENGNKVETITVDGVSYEPNYPEGQEVFISRQNPRGTISFRNEYKYYTGTLVITKKTVKDSGSAYATDRTFYAGIFYDSSYLTHPDEYIVKLDMNNKSSVSESVKILIGRSVDDELTFYVTETDANGRPLRGQSNLGYTFAVSPNNGKVTFTAGDPKSEEVVITNTFTDSGTNHRTGSRTNGAKTGDDAPTALYAGIAAAAVIALFTAAAVRKRRR